MEKQEFLDKLRTALNGRIPTFQVTENVNYYDDYINTEVRKGRTSEEVMRSLGDPRLIAKTIIQTQSGNGAFESQDSEYQEYYADERYQRENSRNPYTADNEREGMAEGFWGRFANSWIHRIPHWLWTVIFLILFILITVVVMKVLTALAPFLIIMGVVILMVKIFRDWLN